MSNKFYAVLLVLAGMVFGILLVSLTSSPAAARLSEEGRVIEKPVPARATTPTRPPRPVLARPNILVYPVGTGGKDDETSFAYVVKDGQLWLCEGTLALEVKFR
jgi:hypothetical protein